MTDEPLPKCRYCGTGIRRTIILQRHEEKHRIREEKSMRIDYQNSNACLSDIRNCEQILESWKNHKINEERRWLFEMIIFLMTRIKDDIYKYDLGGA